MFAKRVTFHLSNAETTYRAQNILNYLLSTNFYIFYDIFWSWLVFPKNNHMQILLNFSASFYSFLFNDSISPCSHASVKIIDNQALFS